MNTTLATSRADGVTFQVNDVPVDDKPIALVKTKKAVEAILDDEVEVACDYADNCVRGIRYNAFLAAAKTAHARHRPLVLTPESVWLTLCQGLSHHIEEHWPEFRDAILLDVQQPVHIVEVSTKEFPFGSPENPWNELISDAASQVRKRIAPEFASLFNGCFSSSQPVDQIAFDVALLAAVKNEFPLLDSVWCGIPRITLTGTPHDWQLIRQKVEAFCNYGLDWWVSPLRAILQQFCAASEGDIDREFWKQFFSVGDWACASESGVTGWIGKLFPYVESDRRGQHRNCLVTGEAGEIPILEHFPSGLRALSMQSQRGSVVRLVGGFVGVSQNLESMELKPKIGWAVQRGGQFQSMLERLSKSPYCVTVTHHAIPQPIDICNPQLQLLYRRFAKLQIRDTSGRELLQLFPTQTMAWEDVPSTKKYRPRLLKIGVIGGRHPLLTTTINNRANHGQLSVYGCPLFFVLTNGEYRHLGWNLQMILEQCMKSAAQSSPYLPENLGTVIDPADDEQISAIQEETEISVLDWA